MPNNKITHLPLSDTYTPEQALSVAQKQNLDDVLILGYSKEGTFVLLSSEMNAAESNFMIDQAKDIVLGRGLEFEEDV